MNKYKHLKDKAVELRNKGLSLDEIVDSLKVSKGTVYSWIKNIPLQRGKVPPNIDVMNKARKEKLIVEYEKAYQLGLEEFNKNRDNKFFRDLILVFLTEGYRKSKNTVEVVNTNAKMIKMCQTVLSKFTTNIHYQVHYHEDRKLETVLDFWSGYLNIDKAEIRTQVKKGNMARRSETCEFGIMHLQVNDYKLRHMMQAWMDSVEQQWNIF